MKHILFVTAFPPNSKTAGQNYSKSLLEDLTKEFAVDLVYWKYPKHEISISDNLKVLRCFNVNNKFKTVLYSILFLLFPFYVVRFSFRKLFYLRRIASNYDILYFDFGQTFLYAKFIEHKCKVKMYHDVISQKYGRTTGSVLYKKLVKISEKRLSDSGDLTLTFSKKDADILLSEYDLKCRVVPFYISTDAIRVRYKMIESDTFVFYGAWNRPENYKGLLWFFDNVYPLTPTKKYIIVGGGMSVELKEKLYSMSNVMCTGFVDNPFTIIASCQALIAPLFKGAGVKVKVIESLATGTPVIGTEIAFEGIDNIAIDELLALNLATTAEEFADRINTIRCTQASKELIKDTFLSNYANEKAIGIITKFANR